VPFNELSAEHQKMILVGKGKYKGVVGSFKALEEKKYKLHIRVFLRRYQASVLCTICRGARLRPESLYFKIKDKNIFDLCLSPLGSLENWFKKIKLKESEQKISEEILRQIKSRIHFLNRMGLHYLNLHRLSKTLSGGESQRIALANQLGSELSGTLYVLDEPSIGLHAIDRDRLLLSLRELVDRGNSVVVVEHDLDTIKTADQVIEMGPKSGIEGGQIVFQGDQKSFLSSNTLTAQFARGEKKIPLPPKRREKSSHWLSLQGCSENNLQDVNFRIPLNRLVGISGVSGSGKSTLVRQTLYNALARLFNNSTEGIGRFKKLFGSDRLKGVSLLDQSPIGRTSRSIPLSVIGAYDEVRKLFSSVAQQRGKAWGPGHFSFNVSGGRCETCSGEGYVTTEMYFLDDLRLICEDCDGKRFKKEVLDLKYRGKSIHDVFQLTASEAKSFFADQKSLVLKFQQLEKVGLGYIQLGQSSQSLSGGESQRLKIAAEIFNVKKKQQLYILDEPTTGLHVSEIALLLELLQDLVDAGNTVVVIEHNLDVLKCVDWLVDLGPGAGVEGGQIVGEGAPEDIASLDTPTGRFIRPIIQSSRLSH
jgi:excinuclease ABC subunit A